MSLFQGMDIFLPWQVLALVLMFRSGESVVVLNIRTSLYNLIITGMLFHSLLMISQYIVSSFTITKQNHGWEHTISGGVSIWANFTILLELVYISTDENGNEESETITSSIRYGEFHCDHQKNIFE